MLAHAVAKQSKNSGIAPLAAGMQNPAAIHAQRKIVFNGRTHFPIFQEQATATPDPPPFLSSLSNVSDSLHKSGNVRSKATAAASGTLDHSSGYEKSDSTLRESTNNENKLQISGRHQSDLALATYHSEHVRDGPVLSSEQQVSPQTLIQRDMTRLSLLQTSAKISAPADSSELEARAIARDIMDLTHLPPGGSANLDELIALIPGHSLSRSQRIDDIDRRSFSPTYATRIDHNTLNMPSGIDAGVPLGGVTGAFMESLFKTDLNHVRIHTGWQAEQLAENLNARAFTVGSHIFFGKDRFQPYSRSGQELIAHEITHTFHQGATVRRTEEEAHTEEERGGLIGEALDYVAEKANLIPGFRMFTIILGVNPINMSSVERSPGNIMRALIEFIPGGALITQALDNHGIFDKVSDWVGQQIEALGIVGGSIKQALNSFLDSLCWSDLLHPGDVWERAKRIFIDPIDRIVSFAKGLVSDIIKFIKDAILIPIAELAQGTRGWDLLIAVLGKNPITGDEVARDASTLIGGFMKLIGKEDVWENMQKANAVGRAWAWFQGAMGALVGFVSQIPTMVLHAFESLTLEDIILVPNAFIKVGAVFANFIGDFISWAGEAVWNLLEIIFDVVSPGALSYIKRTGAALRSILENPLPFVGNLVRAAKLGFENFAAHFGEHLKAGLINWLTGSLPGIYIPQAFSLGEIVKFVFSVLGLSWQIVRQKLVAVVGEPAVKAMETGFDIVVTLVTQGPAAAWDKIQEQLSNLKDMVIGGIIDMVVDAVVKKAIPKLIAMFVPGAGFISAIISIYDTVMVFVNKLSQIGEVVAGFINSIVAIAAGNIGGAASRVESILANILSLAINFLAGFAGLGRIAEKVMGVIEKVRGSVDKGLDALIAWIVRTAKTLFAKVFGKKEKPTESVPEEKKDEDVNNLQRPRIVIAFTLGGQSHQLILDPKGGDETQVEMASGEVLPFAVKYRKAYDAIEYFKQYMSSITDAQVRREFETRLRPMIDKFQAPSVEAWKKIYKERFPDGGRGPPISESEAHSRSAAVSREAEALLAGLKSWGATSGIPDLSEDAVTDTLMKKGQEIWKNAWNLRKQQVDAAISSISYKGKKLDYRGSLKLGYRGHISKNYVRFNPDDFDVDLYAVHEEDYETARAAGAVGSQVFPDSPFAPSELRTTSNAARAALVAVLPDIPQIKDTVVTLRGTAP